MEAKDSRPDFPPAGTQYQVAVQRSRMVVYTTGVVVAVAARLAGALTAPWLEILFFFFLTNGTAVGFSRLYTRGVARLLGVPLVALWLSVDVAIITWAVYLSGGSGSVLFPWYLANVAAAAYASGRRATLAVMAANTVAYLGLVVLTEDPAPALLGREVGKLLVLYGAAFYAVLGISDLQRKRRIIAELKAKESRRAADLESLATALAERTRELDAANARLRVAAITDPLTGLHNRRFLEERIWEDVALVRRMWANDHRGIGLDPRNSDLGFLMVDVDHFKLVNDRYGHDAGDDVLAQLAEVLRAAVRDTDSVIRWGGEEFLLLTRQTNRTYLRAVAGRVGALVRLHRFRLRTGEELRLSVSVGYCGYPLGDPELFPWDEVVRVADEALLLAKQDGRDTTVGVELAAGELSPERQLQILRDLPAAARAGVVHLIRERPAPAPPREGAGGAAT